MTKVCEIIAPSSDQPIVLDVEQYLNRLGLRGTPKFEHYDDAVRAVWPALNKSDPTAQLLVSINVYLACAEKMGFEVKPTFLKEAAKDDLL